MTTRDELLRLATEAVRAGRLPSDPDVPFAPTLRWDGVCSLCAEPLGDAPTFRLFEPDRYFLLHGHCFSAWVEEVVEPTLGADQ